MKLSAALITLCLASACQGGSHAAPAAVADSAPSTATAATATPPAVTSAAYASGAPALPPPGIDDKPAIHPATADTLPATPPATPAQAARSDDGPGNSPADSAQHGPYVLGKGMTADIGAATTLTFERIVSDSRCPKDVQCIWAGEVTIGLRLKSPAGSDTFELSGRANARTVQGHSIELVSYEACPGGPAATPAPGECAILRVDQAAER